MRQRIGFLTLPLLLMAAALIASRLCSNGFAADGTKANEPVETVTFEPGGRLYVPVTVNGDKREFFLNITVPETIIDFSMRDLVGEVTTNGRNTDGPKTLDVRSSPAIVIGEHCADPFELGKRIRFDDFSSMEKYREPSGNGAIGMDYLKTKVLGINFDRNVAQIKNTANSAGSVAEQMNWHGGVPTFLIHHPRAGFVSFRVMLGDVNIMLNNDLYTHLVKKGRIRELPGMDPSGKVFRHHGILDFVEFGPYRLNNQYVEINSVSLIGQQFLSRFNIEFDFPNSTAYIQPSVKIDDPSWYNRAGFVTRSSSNRRLVVVFDGGGPARRAGLRDEDELLEIDRYRSHELSDHELSRILSVPGANVHLKVRREGEIKSIQFELSDGADPFPKLPLRIEPATERDFLERE